MQKLSQQAIILDTETHDLNGLPIEIAYAPVTLEQGQLYLDQSQVFDEYYQVGEPISYASMAVHHILESDLDGKPDYRTFRLAEETQYIIGHNIDYDVQTIAKCGVDVSKLKSICTLALARYVWPTFSAHNISALIYQLSNGSEKARKMLKNAHQADADIILTANILMHLITELQKSQDVQTWEQLYQISEQARVPRVMPFGKHKGVALADLPPDYVEWLLKTEIDLNLRKALEKLFASE